MHIAVGIVELITVGKSGQIVQCPVKTLIPLVPVQVPVRSVTCPGLLQGSLQYRALPIILSVSGNRHGEKSA